MTVFQVNRSMGVSSSRWPAELPLKLDPCGERGLSGLAVPQPHSTTISAIGALRALCRIPLKQALGEKTRAT